MPSNNLTGNPAEYTMKTELIIWHQDHAAEFLPQLYLKYKNLFIQRFFQKGFSEFFHLKDPNSAFELFIKDFKDYCKETEKTDGLSKLDAMEDNIEETEKIFLNLVRMVHTFTRRRKEVNWPVEEIANDVLCHMAEYAENIHPVGMTIEEDLLDCLLFNIPDYSEEF